MLHRVSDPVAILRALADVLEPGGELILETYGSALGDDTPAIEIHDPGEVYAGDDFVYWGFPPEGLRRLARLAGLDSVEIVDQVAVDGHPRIIAVLRVGRVSGLARSSASRAGSSLVIASTPSRATRRASSRSLIVPVVTLSPASRS